MNSAKPDEYLASGQAWADFCEELKQAGQDLLRPTAPNSPLDLAEGHRYLTQMIRSAFELIVEGGNPAAPVLTTSLHETLKLGWDNPDNIHLNAYISDAFEYRLRGTRGDAHYASIAVYGGSYGKSESGRRTVAYVELDDLEIRDDDSFEVILSARTHPGNWIRLEPDSTTLMIRQTFWDRPHEKPGVFKLERLGAEGPPPPLDPGYVVGALRRSMRYIRGTNKLFFHFSDDFRSRPNEFVLSDRERMMKNQGIPDNVMASGWWQLAPDEAAVIDFTPPVCRYWMFVLSDYWGCSFDYRYRPIHTNARKVAYRKDGSVRLIVSHRDPELPDSNWMDTAGHDQGVWQFRWVKAENPPCPEPRIVKFAELRAS